MTSLHTPPRLDTYRLPNQVREEFLSPALLVFPEMVRRNVGAMLAACGGDANRWRPHLKTTKMPAIWRELIAAGVRQFKCATTREASVMLQLLDELGIEGADLLISYPLIGPALERAAALATTHPATRLGVLIEQPDLIDALPANITVFVDVNPEMNRTGVPLADRARIIEIATRAGDRFGGVHFYDGHLRDATADARQSEAHRLYDQLMTIRDELIDAGAAPRELITSGTLTFEAALAYEGFSTLDGAIHRISPGTVVFHDLGTMESRIDTPLAPAAVIMARVVSRPANDVVTCDAGSKSIAAELGDPCAMVIDHPQLTALKPSEEHLPLRVDASKGDVPAPGDVLLLVPRHVCPSVNLAEQAVLIEDGEVTDVVDVVARAHELRPT